MLDSYCLLLHNEYFSNCETVIEKVVTRQSLWINKGPDDIILLS